MAKRKQDLGKNVLTDELIRKSQDTVNRSVSSAMRDMVVFQPIGISLLNYDFVFRSNLPGGAPACTDFDKIYIDPTSGMFVKYDFEKIMNIMMFHEVLHILLYHDKRQGLREHDIWNIATDHVINNLLHSLEEEIYNSNTSKLTIPMGIGNIDHDHICMDYKYKGMSEEEVYNALMKENNWTRKVTYVSYNDFENGNNDPSSETDEPGEGPQIEITRTEYEVTGKNGKKQTRSHTSIKLPKQEPSTAKDKKKHKDLDRQVELSRQMLKSSLTKGVGSSAFQSFMGKLFNVKVDWGKILRDSIMTALEKASELTWCTPRIIWLANPKTIPYLPNYEEEEKYGMVVVAIDESGSMGDDDVKKAIDIIRQAKDHYTGIYVLKHDFDVGWEKLYTDVGEIDINDLLIRRQSGGTSHRDVFEKVNEFQKKNKDDRISAFISVTDMYSDIPETQYLMDMQIPRIYLSTTDFQVANVVGRVIRIN